MRHAIFIWWSDTVVGVGGASVGVGDGRGCRVDATDTADDMFSTVEMQPTHTIDTVSVNCAAATRPERHIAYSDTCNGSVTLPLCNSLLTLLWWTAHAQQRMHVRLHWLSRHSVAVYELMSRTLCTEYKTPLATFKHNNDTWIDLVSSYTFFFVYRNLLFSLSCRVLFFLPSVLLPACLQKGVESSTWCESRQFFPFLSDDSSFVFVCCC